ncbi:MAG: DUF2911 domain-containing protein [Sediminibacterium sp.]|nr:DUF2911 domain-containing protein [Sediminibacterium sp.]
MKKIILLLTLAISIGSLTAQNNNGLKLPNASPSQKVNYQFGSSQIELSYSRPNLRGRTVFQTNSELAPLGKFWRFGANSATKITFKDKVIFGETEVNPGTYSILAIPNSDSWEIILNKDLTTNSENSYKQSEDVARVKAAVKNTNQLSINQQSFELGFSSQNPEQCNFDISWGNAKLTIPIQLVDKNLANTKALSPNNTIVQEFGVGNIDLIYSSPSLKGRAVFQANSPLAPLGQMWRLGANAATSIKFSTDVSFGGKEVKAGDYVLYAIPNEKEWTIILNKGLKNWGTGGYKESDDLVRIKATVQQLQNAESFESFNINFEDVKSETGFLVFRWGTIQVSVELMTDIKKYVSKPMADSLSVKNVSLRSYNMGANYYFEFEKNYPKAVECVQKVIEANPKAYWMYLLKAKILKEMGQKEAAKEAALQCKNIATEEKNPDYVRFAQTLIDNLK